MVAQFFQEREAAAKICAQRKFARIDEVGDVLSELIKGGHSPRNDQCFQRNIIIGDNRGDARVAEFLTGRKKIL